MGLNKIFWTNLLLVLIVGQQQAGTAWSAERTWTDATGEYSVYAELEEVRGDIVLLRRQDGRQIQVPLKRLCAEDQQFLTQRTAENPFQERQSLPVTRARSLRPPLAVAPFDSRQAKAHQKAWADHLGIPVQTKNRLGMKFNLIPPGEFAMGSPASEPGGDDDETQHLVKITRPFYLSVHEVTQAQYQQVMGKSPSYFAASGEGKNRVSGFDTSQFAVEQVSWNDAIAFCGKLGDEEGVKYRLPTEAEWEYACRAGTTTVYSSGDTSFHLDTTGWFADNSGKTVIDSTLIWKTDRDNYALRIGKNLCRPHAVGRKTPNAWGLYDMHGNVWEWCQDWYGPYHSLKVARDPTGPTLDDWPSSNSLVPRRVLRGGAFNHHPEYVRAACRNNNRPDFRNPRLGFRVTRTIPSSP